MNTPEPDWSDERAVVDHLVLQARTFAGAGALTRPPLGLTPRPRSPGPPTSGARRPTSPSPTTARAGASGSARSSRRRSCCTERTTRSFRSATVRRSPPRSRTLVSSDSAASGTGSRPTPSRPSRTSCSRTRRTDRATVETATRLVAPSACGHGRPRRPTHRACRPDVAGGATAGAGSRRNPAAFIRRALAATVGLAAIANSPARRPGPPRRRPPAPRRPGMAPPGPRPGAGCTSSWPPGPAGRTTTASCPSWRGP